MKAIVVDESFTATTNEKAQSLAAAYKVYVEALEIAVGNPAYTEICHQSARNALGKDFESARICYELKYV